MIAGLTPDQQGYIIKACVILSVLSMTYVLGWAYANYARLYCIACQATL